MLLCGEKKEKCIRLRFFDVVVCKIPAGRDTDTIIALPKKQACGITKDEEDATEYQDYRWFFPGCYNDDRSSGDLSVHGAADHCRL